MKDKEVKCDVLIIGASFAGNALARQLKLLDPSISIAQFERKTSYNSWIGESTVEAWENYMTQNLQMGSYLEKNFMQKHGLRFFFDNKEKNLPLDEMSEVGRSRYHGLTSRQVDREILDTDMVAMNREMGVEVNMGESLSDPENNIVIDHVNGHTVKTDKRTYRCKYLVDAGGTTSPLGKKFGDRTIEKRHVASSSWAKFVGTAEVDEFGGKEWKKRVNNTLRNHSTNHFMYEGYWVWAIPLSDNSHSIGISWANKYGKKSIKTPEKLEAFLREHKCLDQLLGPNATLEHFMTWNGITAQSSKVFSEELWFRTGMAAFFIDPMTSGGNRIASNINTLLCETILTHRKGEQKVFESQLKHFNRFFHAAYEGHYNNLTRFDWFGCFDIWSTFYDGIINKYWNSTFPASVSDYQHMKDTARSHADGCQCDLSTDSESIKQFWQTTYGSAVHRITEEMLGFVNENQAYHDHNENLYHDCGLVEEQEKLFVKLFEGTNPELEHKNDVEHFRFVFRSYVEKMCVILGEDFDHSQFDLTFEPDWKKGQTLQDVLTAVAGQKMLKSA